MSQCTRCHLKLEHRDGETILGGYFCDNCVQIEMSERISDAVAMTYQLRQVTDKQALAATAIRKTLIEANAFIASR